MHTDTGAAVRAEKFPVELTALSRAIQTHLRQPVIANLDLGANDYEFHVAGECNVPGIPTVNMIYRPRAGSGHHDA